MNDQYQIEGLNVGVGWVGVDPTKWRDLPEPDDINLDDDEDLPVPSDVFSLTGINPDAEGWNDSE